MNVPAFDPRDLRPIKEFCTEGLIPLNRLSVQRLCRKKEFPAVKVGNDWCTTLPAVRSYLWRKANKAFREINS